MTGPGEFVEIEHSAPIGGDWTPKRTIRVGRSVNPDNVLFLTGDTSHLGEWAVVCTLEEAHVLIDALNEMVASIEEEQTG